jgi:uncharacterized RDD family membrane protein YckC
LKERVSKPRERFLIRAKNTGAPRETTIEELTGSTPRSARAWKRVLAFCIDLYFGLVVTWSFFTVIAQELPSTPAAIMSAGQSALNPLVFTLFLFACAFFVLYHVFCEYSIGQTPGMLIVGIRVQRRAQSAQAVRSERGRATKRTDASADISLGQAFVRNIFLFPVLPFTLLWLIEPLYYAFNGERLLESWSKTHTIEESR